MKQILLAIVVTILVSACVTSGNDVSEPKKVDPRQGEEVNQICFNRNMDGWSPLEGNNKAILVTDRRRDEYKLDLIGTCDPQWAMMRIATISRGNSSCLSRGDKIVTDADMNMQDSCTIRRIYKWHPDKLELKKPSQDETEKQSKDDAGQ